MRRYHQLLRPVAVGLLAQACVAGDVLYRVRALGYLDPNQGGGGARAINGIGQACGGSPVAPYPSERAFLWEPAVGMVDLGDLPGGRILSEGAAINNAGRVAGFSDGERGVEAFLWSPKGGMMALGRLPGGDYSEAMGMNDLDQVVGYGLLPDHAFEAFLWDPQAGMIGLGDLPGGDHGSSAWDINNAGTVVGSGSTNGTWFRAFVWDAEGGMRTIPRAPDGSTPAYGLAINELGQVTGPAATAQGYNQTFLWTPGEDVRIIRFGYWSGGRGINDLGQIVGQYSPDGIWERGFVWDEVNGARAIADVIDEASRQRHGDRYFAVSINNAGQIGGSIPGQAVILTPFVLGDMNCDETVDAFDIEAFVTGLVDPPAYRAAWPGCFRKSAGDINQDGEFDAFDIEPFVEMLSAP